MRYEIKRIHQLTRTTIVYVTHDQTEATTLGERIAVLNAGKIEQIDTAQNIYEKPNNLFVASFIGSPEMNLLPGAIFGKDREIIGIRPENLKILETPKKISNPIHFDVCEYLGSTYLYHARFANHDLRLVTDKQIPFRDKEFYFDLELTKLLHFDNSTGQRINEERTHL